MFFNREGVSGTIDNRQFIRADTPIFKHLFEASKRYRSSRFNSHTFAFCQSTHGSKGFRVRDRFHQAAKALGKIP